MYFSCTYVFAYSNACSIDYCMIYSNCGKKEYMIKQNKNYMQISIQENVHFIGIYLIYGFI